MGNDIRDIAHLPGGDRNTSAPTSKETVMDYSMLTLERAFDTVEDIQQIIDYLAATSYDDWQLDVVRSADGSKNCFFGHLFQWAENAASEHGASTEDARLWANLVWEAFEERWATTYVIYPINDGSNPRYPQATAKERVIAYLTALRDGEEMTTLEAMEADAAAFEAA